MQKILITIGTAINSSVSNMPPPTDGITKPIPKSERKIPDNGEKLTSSKIVRRKRNIAPLIEIKYMLLAKNGIPKILRKLAYESDYITKPFRGRGARNALGELRVNFMRLQYG